MDKLFEDERSENALRDLVLAFKCLEKLYDNRIDKLTDKEMMALYDVGYLAFDNYYGDEISSIGHLTKYGRQEVFKHYREEILKKCEHLIIKLENY